MVIYLEKNGGCNLEVFSFVCRIVKESLK